ncbi:hypothetical protein [Bacillus sp. PS06]|uniref:hypothetical protein n=1 Tax=Bacillus sp. PS06 TaxID=2764176 RepID=UPI00178045DA|nr:hypothetical protein [Bacillus sp. PS06]MBD8070071.1 hypothetical protein [Bacillus sp. PS06]
MLNSFIEVTDKKSKEKILINTLLVIEVRENRISVANGFSLNTYKTEETYDELKEKLNAR